MLGQFEEDGTVVVADFEAGLGTLSRMEAGAADVLLVIAEPTQKSIEVARRALAIIAERNLGRPILVANRIRADADRALITEAFPHVQSVAIPDDPAIRAADLEGRAAIDAARDAPGVRALSGLALALADRDSGRAIPQDSPS